MKFLILLLVVKTVFSLKSTDLCLSSKKDCKKTSDPNFTRQCESFKCTGTHSFQCTPEHCATSHSVCKEFFNMGYKLKSLTSFRSKLPMEKIFNQKMNEYLSLVKSFGKCSTRRYETTQDDVCTSGSGCQLKQDLPLRYGEITIVSNIDCPCDGYYNFRCGREYCAKSKLKCEQFLWKQKNGSFIDVGECGNDNRVIYEKTHFDKHQRLDFLF